MNPLPLCNPQPRKPFLHSSLPLGLLVCTRKVSGAIQPVLSARNAEHDGGSGVPKDEVYDRSERDADEDPEEEDVRVEEVGYAEDVDG